MGVVTPNVKLHSKTVPVFKFGIVTKNNLTIFQK